MLTQHRALVGALVVVAAAACFGTLGPASRLAYEAGMSPLGFVAWRALLGAVVVLAFVAWRRRRGIGYRSLMRLPRSERIALAVAAISGLVLNLSIFIAFSRVSVALALLGFYTYPAMVTVAALFVHRERLDRARVIALVLALIGMVLVVAGQLDPSGTIAFDLVGFALALLAATAQTVYITISRHGYRSVRSEQAISVVLVAGAIGYALVAMAVGAGSDLTYPLRDAGVWPLLLFAGVLGAGVPGLFFLVGVRWIGGTRTSILALFEPVTGVVLAALLLGESLRPIQVLGGLLILLAAALLQRTPEAAVPPGGAEAEEPAVPALV